MGRRQPSQPGDLAAAELPPADGPADGALAGFPTFSQRTLATLVQDNVADRVGRSETIGDLREEYPRDLLLAPDEDIRPPSMTTDGARSIL